MQAHIPINRERLIAFCQQHHIRRLALFGSVLTDRFTADSDVDVLVEFEPGSRVGLFDIARMEQELTDLMGREADLRTPADLSPYFREDVLKHAKVQYAA